MKYWFNKLDSGLITKKELKFQLNLAQYLCKNKGHLKTANPNSLKCLFIDSCDSNFEIHNIISPTEII